MTTDELSILADEMEAFVRAGGTFSYSEWAELDQDIKATLIAAGNRLRLEQAKMIGLAMQGQAGLARLLALEDGGDEWVRYNLSSAMNQAEEKYKK